MVDISDAVNITQVIPEPILENIGYLVTLLQALGIIIIAYFIFNIVSLIINRKRLKELRDINERLIRIEKKIGVKSKKD